MCSGYKYRQFAVVCLANQVMSESMCSRPFCQDACSDSCHTISPQCSTEELYNAGKTNPFYFECSGCSWTVSVLYCRFWGCLYPYNYRSLCINSKPYTTPIDNVCALVAVAAAGLALRCTGASGAASMQTLNPETYM